MFDINTAEDLFFHIREALKSFSGNRGKNVRELLFLVMALNHLREWIAPGYKRDHKGVWPITNGKNEEFFLDIWKLPEFKTINKLCNGTKHCIVKNPKTTDVEYGLPIDEWSDIDGVQDFDSGQPQRFEVDGVNVETVMKTVQEYYSKNWFDKP